eukprot:scaffold127278_cov69-Phaeocystis_antarctica.AAC.2
MAVGCSRGRLRGQSEPDVTISTNGRTGVVGRLRQVSVQHVRRGRQRVGPQARVVRLRAQRRALRARRLTGMGASTGLVGGQPGVSQ